MVKKYIVHENSLLYTSHGELMVCQLHDAYVNNKISDDFMVAGWYPHKETRGKFYSMKKLVSDKGFNVTFGGYERPDVSRYYYVGSKLLNEKLNIVELQDNMPPFYVILTNGYAECKSVHKMFDNDNQVFYIIETDVDDMYVNGTVLKALPDEVKEKPANF